MAIMKKIGFILEAAVFITGYMVTIGTAAVFILAWVVPYFR